MKTCRSVLAGVVLLSIYCPQTTLSASQPAKTKQPLRVVALSPHLAELMFAAGAGDLLVGTVAYSDYPPQAQEVPRIGDAFRIDLEQLAALQPDLILAWRDGSPQTLIGSLRGDGYKVLALSATGLASVESQLRRIGEITGHQEQADRVADRYHSRIDHLRAANLDKSPVRVFYQISQQPLFTIGRDQVIGEVLALCGGTNIFGDLDNLAPVVSMEAVLLRDPQVILSGETGKANPLDIWLAYRAVTAVRRGNLFLIDASLLARPGLRLADGAARVCHLLDQARRNMRYSTAEH